MPCVLVAVEVGRRQVRRLEPFLQFCNTQLTPCTLPRLCKLDSECEKQMLGAD